MGLLTDTLTALAAPDVSDKVSLPALAPAYPFLDLVNGGRYYPYEHDRAYYSNAFRACLLAKSRPVSSLPVDVYTRDGDVRRKSTSRVAKALSGLLRKRWNPFVTGSEGVRWMLMTKDTLGNAYVRVQWSSGVPVALWPMRMEAQPTVDGGEVVFCYPGDKFTPEGRYLSHEVIWLKSPILDSDGFKGVSLADLAARELGLSIDLEEFYERLLSNGNHFPGWLETDHKLSEADVEVLRKRLDQTSGVKGAGNTRIFDRGLTYHQTPLTMADMSLVDQERWILQQTCRTLSVPPQEVFELSNATYSNIEQGAINFATKTLSYECFTLEKAFSDVLWSAGHDDEYVQFDLNGLLRGDYASRMQGYQTAIYAGMYSPNMALAKEDEAPYEGGDVRFRSSAYIPVDPVTGEELEGARNGSAAKPGGSGEGVAYDPGNPNGRPPEDSFSPVHEDMERRVAERFRDKGDCEATRAFATRVLKPWASACLMARIPYDIEADIDRIAEEATNA